MRLILAALASCACGTSSSPAIDGASPDAHVPPVGFEHAVDVPFGESATAVVNDDLVSTLFRVDAPAGWTRIRPGADGVLVTRVYDASGALYATAAWPTFFTWLPSPGIWYVEVDAVDPGPGVGVAVDFQLSAAAGVATIDGEDGDGTAAATPIIAPHVLGRFDHPGDVDAFAMTDEDAPGTYLAIPGGGQAEPPGALSIVLEDGTIVARVEAGDGRLLRPWAPRGAFLTVEPRSPAGDFYVVEVESGGRWASHAEWALAGTIGGNDTVEDASSPPLLVGPDEAHFNAVDRLPDGDVDVFAADFGATSAGVTCHGEVHGSGVRGLTAAFVDRSGGVIAQASETATAPVLIPTMALPDEPRIYLRVTKSGHDPEVTGDFYWCSVWMFE